MTSQETLQLLKKCDTEVKKFISSIKNTLEPTQNPDFKLMVIESKDTLKTYEEQFKIQINQLQETTPEENKVTDALSKAMINTKLLTNKTDQHIASLIFDASNTCLKELYKALNEASNPPQNIQAIIEGVTTTILNLRKNLMSYL